MSIVTLITLSTFLSLLYISTAGVPVSSFLRASCNATTYPEVCIESLAVYASTIKRSPRQLVNTALSVSVDRAKLTKRHVERLSKFRGLKAREYAALKDCVEEMADGLDHLTESVQELKKIGRATGTEYIWHMSNLQTWVSAALTDDSSCLDGFSGRAMNGRIKFSVRVWMTNLAKVTSNALALSNEFAGKY